MKEYTVLICDDDADIVSALAVYLTQDGYRILKAGNGREAVEAVSRYPVHVILMDVMMPEMDGIHAAAAIRAASNVPILFLSARSEECDRVLGLTMGGDDYISKPFNPVELLARVKAHLRRYTHLGGLPPEPEAQGLYRAGGLVVDDIRKCVTVDGEEAVLTAVEYNILLFLIQHTDHVFTSSQIYEQVWGEPAFEVGKIISVHIRHIREKIEINPKEPRYLKVLYGLGYKLQGGK